MPSSSTDRCWLVRENPVRRAERPGRRRRGSNPDLQFLSVSELEAVIRAIPNEVVVRRLRPRVGGAPALRRRPCRTCSAPFCAC